MIEQTPDYFTNAEKCRDDESPCVRCGRPFSPDSKTATWVEMSTSWDVIPEGDPRSGGPDSQGCFPVGPECIKHLKTKLDFNPPMKVGQRIEALVEGRSDGTKIVGHENEQGELLWLNAGDKGTVVQIWPSEAAIRSLGEEEPSTAWAKIRWDVEVPQGINHSRCILADDENVGWRRVK